jgi:uncharacterized protein (DUF58 family)
MRPGRRLLILLSIWTLLGLSPVLWPETLPVWLLIGGLGLVSVGWDAWILRVGAPISVQRLVPGILPLGAWRDVKLRFNNPTDQTYRLTVFDHYPQPAELTGLPQTIQVIDHGWTEIVYRIRPLERGEMYFGTVQTLLDSRYRLWQRTLKLAEPMTVKVYPDFATLAQYALLATDHRITAMGIHKRRRRGEGQDFHQLREYRVGDTLRQIDWKATARTRKLIAKEYQEERDQSVVFLIDGSRRMRTRDGPLSHFDHALNAMILLAYVALHQGDAVGVQSFGGDLRWLAPKKGNGFLNTLIRTVYDLQPTLQPADYTHAASLLMTRQRKRALLVLLTNLRDEDSDELSAAIGLLKQRHVVLLASLREHVLDDLLNKPVETLPQARLYGATCHYLAARERCREKLYKQGSLILDVPPQELPIAVVNRYWDIKRSGRL